MSEGFVKVANVAELGDGDMMMVTARGVDVLLARVGDEYFALDNNCTHRRGGMLDQGSLIAETREVECPIHAARFSLRTGEVTKGPANIPVARYSVKVEGGTIFVRPSNET